MSIKEVEVTFYKVECDGCGADAHEAGEYSAWSDDGDAREDAFGNGGWLIEIGPTRLDFCPACSKGPDGEPADCGHDEVSTVGLKQWKCSACGLKLGDPEASESPVDTGPKPLTAEEFGGIETPHGRIFESAGGTWVAYGHLSKAVFREAFNWVDPEVRGDPILAEEAIDIDHRWATLHQDVNDADDEWEIRWHATISPGAPGAFPVTVLL